MQNDLHNRTASNWPGFHSNFSLGLRWAMIMFEWDKESFEAQQFFRNGDHQYQWMFPRFVEKLKVVLLSISSVKVHRVDWSIPLIRLSKFVLWIRGTVCSRSAGLMVPLLPLSIITPIRVPLQPVQSLDFISDKDSTCAHVGGANTSSPPLGQIHSKTPFQSWSKEPRSLSDWIFSKGVKLCVIFAHKALNFKHLSSIGAKDDWEVLMVFLSKMSTIFTIFGNPHRLSGCSSEWLGWVGLDGFALQPCTKNSWMLILYDFITQEITCDEFVQTEKKVPLLDHWRRPNVYPRFVFF